MQAQTVKGSIKFTTRDQVIEFLQSKPDVDQVVEWVCPECHKVNTETHFCRGTRCECGKYVFPRIGLPITGDANISLKVAIDTERLKKIVEEIKEYNYEIRSHESEIAELEGYIYELEKERRALTKGFE